MVIIEVDDDVWEAISRAWALLGIRGYDNVARFLEQGLWEEANDMLDDAEKQLMSDEPEALVRRAIGIEKEKERGLHNSQ
jgi:hypothetical protein